MSKLKYEFPRQLQRFRRFKDFAQASLSDIFGEETLKTAHKLEATELASGIFYQQKDGRFLFTPLPRESQLAPIYTFSALDVNNDGYTDLFHAGNNFRPEPTTGRFDGSLGLLLANDGHGNLNPIGSHISGISIPGEVRASIVLPSGQASEQRLVVALTNGPILLFEPLNR